MGGDALSHPEKAKLYKSYSLSNQNTCENSLSQGKMLSKNTKRVNIILDIISVWLEKQNISLPIKLTSQKNLI